MKQIQEQRFEACLNAVQNQKFRRAAEILELESDRKERNLKAELERLAGASDMISNYQDRIIDDLAKALHKDTEDGENGSEWESKFWKRWSIQRQEFSSIIFSEEFRKTETDKTRLQWTAW